MLVSGVPRVVVSALHRGCLVALFATLLLAGCGGASDTIASASDAKLTSNTPGNSAFISAVRIDGTALRYLSQVRYTIQAKPGSASRPVSVSYTFDALKRRGQATEGGSRVTLPVFGLYSGYRNSVDIQLTFSDASTQRLQADITTATFVDPNATFDRPKVTTKRSPGSSLGFDFFYIKPLLGVPLVVDSDGELRWVGIGSENGISSTFYDNAFIVGDQKSMKFRRLELDGTSSQSMVQSASYRNFHHNIDPGKQGLLIQVDAGSDGVVNLESIIADVSPSGQVLKQWDFAALLRDHMTSRGDDPSLFVRPGIDWFHTNAATYDPRDDSLIVSSRENFVIKVDYQTGNIIWILGDPTKYWYSFPSLRAKALQLAGGGLYPIGQHATSITSDGLLMLFNDGTPSRNQPAGAPIGAGRTYSAVSAYAIDASTLTAREAWRFDHGQSLSAPFCSSSYEGRGKSLLVTYSGVRNGTAEVLTGLDADHKIVFEFEYRTTGCDTVWNSQIIAFDNLTFR